MRFFITSLFIFGLFLVTSNLFAEQYQLNGRITGIENGSPVYVIAMTQQEWDSEAEITGPRRKRYTPSGSTLEFSFRLPEGSYCLFIFQDSNGNGEIDRNLFGVPSEDFAMSRNYNPLRSLRKPDFSDIEIPLNQNRRVSIQMIDR
jgi:uncharacterized protein (DUF2141 family)